MAAVSTGLLGFPARWLGHRLDILDRPKHRSSHQNPTPRTGGPAILLGMVAAALVLGAPLWPTLPLGGMVLTLAVLGFLDDMYSLRASIRFVVQLAVSAAAAWMFSVRFFGATSPDQPLFWVSLGFSTLFIVAFINFFNFMDGINGIACFQGVIGGGAICLLVLAGGGSSFTVGAAAALAGACLGFLPHNFPRARMFMGDAGSMVLGFLLALLSLQGAGECSVPWLALAMPLGIFIYDPIFTLFKRASRGENVVQPHREHHYQLLIRCGWSHPRVTILEGALMALCAGGGALYARTGAAGQWAVLGGLLAVAAGYSVLVHRYFSRHRLDAAPAKPQPAPEGQP